MLAPLCLPRKKRLNVIVARESLGSYQRRLQWVGFLFVLPVLLYFVVFYWFNLIQAFALSFQQTGARRELHFVGLATYREVFAEPTFMRSLQNTVVFSIQTVAATVSVGLLISIGIYNVRHPLAKQSATVAFVLPTLVSLVAAGIIWRWLYHTRFGAVNQLLLLVGMPRMQFLLHEVQAMPSMAVINTWVRVGYAVLILHAGLQGIPTTLFDSARVDGAKGFKLYRYVVFPLLTPHIAAVTLLEVIFAARVFDIVYVTTQGGPANATRVIMLYLYDNAFRFNRPEKAAVAAVVMFLVLLVAGIVQRKIVSLREYEY